ncbi:hypothetical protein DFH09DRAFT_1468247 [Mycena vulgaris]|nr:hypothetical protein DFH09DRAFT_1468247 [Mycena vulgaris]
MAVELCINEVILGTLFGIVIGPNCANLVDPGAWGPTTDTITLEVMRVPLGIGLIAIGVELPRSGWCPDSGSKYAVKNVPLQLRQIISAQSAANDGLAYSFLSISIYLTVETSCNTALGKGFLVGWLYRVIPGVVLGALLGWRRQHTRSDDLLAAFAAGSAVSWDGHFNDVIENEVFSSVIDLLFNCGCFVYIGAWTPLNSFYNSALGITLMRLTILFIGILALRRIPPVLLLHRWVSEIRTWREALFTGQFGPMCSSCLDISSTHEIIDGCRRDFHFNTSTVTFAEPSRSPTKPAGAPGRLPSAHRLICRSRFGCCPRPVDPLLFLGGSIHSRTRSLFTALARTDTAAQWLLGLQRLPAMLPVNPGREGTADPLPQTMTVVDGTDTRGSPGKINQSDGSSGLDLKTTTGTGSVFNIPAGDGSIMQRSVDLQQVAETCGGSCLSILSIHANNTGAQ